MVFETEGHEFVIGWRNVGFRLSEDSMSPYSPSLDVKYQIPLAKYLNRTSQQSSPSTFWVPLGPGFKVSISGGAECFGEA